MIAFYADHRILWNAKDPEYYKRDRRESLLVQLRNLLYEDCHLDVTVIEIKTKFKYLRNSFVREERKVNSSKSSSADGVDVRVPKWVHYKDLTFLRDAGEPDESQDSLTSQHFRNEEDMKMEVVGPPMADCVNVVEFYAETPSDDTAAVCRAEAESRSPASTSPPHSSASCSNVDALSTMPLGCNAPHIWRKRPLKRARPALENACIDLLQRASQVCKVLDEKMDGPSHFGNLVADTLRKLTDDLQEDAKMEMHMILYKYIKKMRGQPAD